MCLVTKWTIILVNFPAYIACLGLGVWSATSQIHFCTTPAGESAICLLLETKNQGLAVKKTRVLTKTVLNSHNGEGSGVWKQTIPEVKLPTESAHQAGAGFRTWQEINAGSQQPICVQISPCYLSPKSQRHPLAEHEMRSPIELLERPGCTCYQVCLSYLIVPWHI